MKDGAILRLGFLLLVHDSVRGAEVDRQLLQLADTAARANRLVVNFDIAGLDVFRKHLGIQGVGESRPCPCKLRNTLSRAARMGGGSRQREADGGDDQNDATLHDFSPCWG